MVAAHYDPIFDMEWSTRLIPPGGIQTYFVLSTSIPNLVDDMNDKNLRARLYNSSSNSNSSSSSVLSDGHRTAKEDELICSVCYAISSSLVSRRPCVTSSHRRTV